MPVARTFPLFRRFNVAKFFKTLFIKMMSELFQVSYSGDEFSNYCKSGSIKINIPLKYIGFEDHFCILPTFWRELDFI